MYHGVLPEIKFLRRLSVHELIRHLIRASDVKSIKCALKLAEYKTQIRTTHFDF